MPQLIPAGDGGDKLRWWCRTGEPARRYRRRRRMSRRDWRVRPAPRSSLFKAPLTRARACQPSPASSTTH